MLKNRETFNLVQYSKQIEVFVKKYYNTSILYPDIYEFGRLIEIYKTRYSSTLQTKEREEQNEENPCRV
jgi:hypothetical protein